MQRHTPIFGALFIAGVLAVSPTVASATSFGGVPHASAKILGPVASGTGGVVAYLPATAPFGGEGGGKGMVEFNSTPAPTKFKLTITLSPAWAKTTGITNRTIYSTTADLTACTPGTLQYPTVCFFNAPKFPAIDVKKFNAYDATTIKSCKGNTCSTGAPPALQAIYTYTFDFASGAAKSVSGNVLFPQTNEVTYPASLHVKGQAVNVYGNIRFGKSSGNSGVGG